MWEETLVFNIQMPQIALVRFEVWDHDPIGRDFIGQRTVAFTSMMPGSLHDMQTLCVRVFFKISQQSNNFTGRSCNQPRNCPTRNPS